MDCEIAQETFSADLDGEAPLEEVAAALGHASRCLPCQRARREMGALHLALREAPVPRSPDYATLVVAESRSSFKVRRGLARLALAMVAIFLLVDALPGIWTTSGPAHLEHHLAIWSFTFALVLMIVALRPSLSRVVRPVATVFALAMIAVAILDAIRGETPMLAEWHHLLELTGVFLIWVISMPAATTSDEPATPGLHLVTDTAHPEAI